MSEISIRELIRTPLNEIISNTYILRKIIHITKGKVFISTGKFLNLFFIVNNMLLVIKIKNSIIFKII